MFNYKPERQGKTVIGKGNFSEVYSYGPKNKKSVVKVQTVSICSQKLNKVMQELVLGFSCDHPNVLPVKGFFIDIVQNGTSTPVQTQIQSQTQTQTQTQTIQTFYVKELKVYMKLPRMKYSLQSKFLKNAKGNKTYIRESQILKYFYEITCGLAYLHQKKIAHMDIKPANILIDEEGSIKIADIGLAHFNEGESSSLASNIGFTFSHVAPEILENRNKLKKKDLCKADLWSLGVTMVELCLLESSLVYPFCTSTEKEEKWVDYITSLKDIYSPLLIKLLLNLLKCDPNQRITATELKAKLEAAIEQEENNKVEASLKESCHSFKENLKDVVVSINNKEHESVSKLDELKLSEQNGKRMQEFEEEVKNDVAMVASACKNPEEQKSPEPMKGNTLPYKSDLSLLSSEMQKNIFSHVEQMHRIHSQLLLNHFGDILKRNPNEWNKINIMEEARKKFFVRKNDNKYLKVTLKAESYEQPNKEKEIESEAVKNNIVVHSQTRYQPGELREYELQGRKESLLTVRDQLSEIYQNFFTFEANQTEQSLNIMAKDANCMEITDFSIQELAIQISNLKDLQALNLPWTSCINITDSGLKGLASQIGANLKNLEYFMLSLYCGKGITDTGFQHFVKGITENLANLKALKLYFNAGENITDSGLNGLASHIGSISKHLDTLKLSFCFFKHITDSGVIGLASQLGSNLKNLKTLRLDFRGCLGLTKDSIFELASQIYSNREDLTVFELVLDKCCYNDEVEAHLHQTFDDILDFKLISFP